MDEASHTDGSCGDARSLGGPIPRSQEGPGRLRLGVGLGWNEVEYEALGEDFSSRGAKLEEQVQLMRRLWCERSISYEGRFHRVTGAGLGPLLTRQVPVWMGGSSSVAYRRIGRLADGWFPLVAPGEKLERARDAIASGASGAGRDPGAIGMECKVCWKGSAERIAEHAGRWRQAGATHLGVNTMGAGLVGLDAHLDALERAAGVLFG